MSDMPEGYYHSAAHLDSILVGFSGGVYVGKSASRASGVKRASRPRCAKIRDFLIDRDGRDCHYCKITMRGVGTRMRKDTMTIEHIVPVSLGGTYNHSNLVLACYRCNSRFGNQLNKCECKFCKSASRVLDTAAAVC